MASNGKKINEYFPMNGLGAGRDWGRGTVRKVVDPGRCDYLWGNCEYGGLRIGENRAKKI